MRARVEYEYRCSELPVASTPLPMYVCESTKTLTMHMTPCNIGCTTQRA